jgi:ABC-type dipeptide/oligopeptide/nickel transport system permease component
VPTFPAHALIQRLLTAIPVLFGVLLIGFVMLQVIPTDPATIIAGPTGTAEEIEVIRRQLGLDQPLWVQFWLYITRVAQGDLGRSIINNAPVARELATALVPTLELMLMSLIWAVPLGIFLGTVAAMKRGRLFDRAVMALSVAGVSVPVFWVGLLLLQFAAYRWQLFPLQGRGGPLWTLKGLSHIVLPAITLGVIFIGPVARMTRTTVVEALNADFVRTARAKGASEFQVVTRHALRAALIPIVTLIGLQIGALLGGAVITETIFAWPGIGRLAVGAIVSSDVPMAQGTILVLAMGYIVVNFIVDLLYGVLDPRVRSGSR